MTPGRGILGRLRPHFAERLGLDARGVSAMEFALSAPVLIVLIVGGFTLFQLIRANYVADKATFAVGDVMSRQLIANAAIFNHMQATLRRLAWNDIGQPELRVSSISRGSGGYTVDWTHNTQQGELSKSALPMHEVPEIAQDDSVLLTETLVKVRPFLNGVLLGDGGTVVYRNVAVTRPRFVGRLSKQ